ncbi:hypothetical protein UlMin_007397 [Ulmus minor]
MEAGPIFNHEILSEQDLANDQRQPSSSYFAETDMLQEFNYPILASTLEALLRKVVREEIDHKLQQYLSPEILALTKPSSLPQIQAKEQPRFKLVFPKNLKLPIFTANKLLDIENNPPEIHLVDINSNIGEQMTPISLHSAPKVELVVLNGDFPPKGCESWTSNQFEANIVKERNDKPPLLLGELIVTLNGGSATIGDIEFSDNSSWIRSRKFKIGARLVPGTNLQGSVLEAMTEGFVVKEYRVGLTRKHETPMGHDEVWRLVKIGKDGVFHKRLASHHINTVLNFLNLFDNDPKKLRRILGAEMSDKKWEAVLKHAKKCKVDNNVAQELGSSRRATLTQYDFKFSILYIIFAIFYCYLINYALCNFFGSQDLQALLGSPFPSQPNKTSIVLVSKWMECFPLPLSSVASILVSQWMIKYKPSQWMIKYKPCFFWMLVTYFRTENYVPVFLNGFCLL